jgi:thiosulfate/3-mercaptopyruvate sulfurtransferase
LSDFVEHPLVSTDWLADHLHDPDLRVVDARWLGTRDSHAAYRSAHIPGAVHLDWARDLSTTINGLRYMLLPPDDFAAVMSAAGIGDETRVVAYAHRDYSGAARLWWALRYYGHEQVAVLDGGITKWQAEARFVEWGDAPAYPPATFTPRPDAAWLATADEIAAGGDALRVVDTRPPEQYAGRAVWTPEGSAFLVPDYDTIDIGARAPMRAGHIPGALHLESSLNLDAQSWAYLPTEALRARFEAAGLHPDQRVITYCGVGISASLGLFALWLAGYRNVALYDSSWEEWGTDGDRPVER